MIKATKLTAQDQARIRARIREVTDHQVTATSVGQVREATELAIAVYMKFAEHGISRNTLGYVTDIPTAVVDAIKARDHNR